MIRAWDLLRICAADPFALPRDIATRSCAHSGLSRPSTWRTCWARIESASESQGKLNDVTCCRYGVARATRLSMRLVDCASGLGIFFCSTNALVPMNTVCQPTTVYAAARTPILPSQQWDSPPRSQGRSDHRYDEDAGYSCARSRHHISRESSPASLPHPFVSATCRVSQCPRRDPVLRARGPPHRPMGNSSRASQSRQATSSPRHQSAKS